MNRSSEVYKVAKRLIKRFGTRNPKEIAKQLGIVIRYSDELGDLLGLYTNILRNRVIILNSRLNEFQQIMVLAHELGHDILHRKLAREGCLQEYQLFDMRSETEYEANAFAAQLLIDDDQLMEYIRDYQYNVYQIAGEMNINPNLLNIKLSEMNRLGYNFNIMDVNPKFLKNEKPIKSDWDIC